jgi:intracellular multiplication protein IcmK
VVELTPHLVTALVFLDDTGKGWPVTSSVLGSGTLFNIEVLEGENRNRVIVSPLSSHGNSNLIITLENHDVPIVISLETRTGIDPTRKVDGLIIYQVEGKGPYALPQTSKNLVNNPVSDLMYSILDGIKPQGSRKIDYEPVREDTILYSIGNTLYIRTKGSLMWPSHKAKAAGAAGYFVYETIMSPTVLMAIGEEVIKLRVANKGGGILDSEYEDD